MKADKIMSCYVGPQISPEQFVAEHFFLYLIKGSIKGYDGHRSYSMKPGECCLVRKNQLVRYHKEKENGAFEKVVVVFDQDFLRQYIKSRPPQLIGEKSDEAFLTIRHHTKIPLFLQSLQPHFDEQGKMDPVSADLKREELLSILLSDNPGLADILFDFSPIQKIDLEAFMNRNFRFNVAIQRFAYLTGRSLTHFKQDFKKKFNDTPGRWLLKKRLQEAHFLIKKQGKKASDVYVEVGFEDLSHFSFAFKKRFGVPPTQLTKLHS